MDERSAALERFAMITAKFTKRASPGGS